MTRWDLKDTFQSHKGYKTMHQRDPKEALKSPIVFGELSGEKKESVCWL